jgi:hypothetical protein
MLVYCYRVVFATRSCQTARRIPCRIPGPGPNKKRSPLILNSQPLDSCWPCHGDAYSRLLRTAIPPARVAPSPSAQAVSESRRCPPWLGVRVGRSSSEVSPSVTFGVGSASLRCAVWPYVRPSAKAQCSSWHHVWVQGICCCTLAGGEYSNRSPTNADKSLIEIVVWPAVCVAEPLAASWY